MATQITFRVTEDEYNQILEAGSHFGLQPNQFSRELALNLRNKKTIVLKPAVETVRNFFENQLSDLKAQLAEAKAAGTLNGIQVNEKSVEQRVQEMLDQRDFVQLKQNFANLEKKVTELEEELEESEEQLQEQAKQLKLMAIAEKIAPGLLNGFVNGLSPQVRDKIGHGLAGLLGAASDDTAANAELSAEQQEQLALGSAIAQEFTQPERAQLVTLIQLLSKDKVLLPRVTKLIQDTFKPSMVA